MKVNKLSTGIEIQDSKIGVFICYDGDGKDNPSIDVYEKNSNGKISRWHKIFHNGTSECLEYDMRGYSHGTYSWRPDMWFDDGGNYISELEYNNTRS